MAITVNKVLYWAKKLFRLWKKYDSQNKPKPSHGGQQYHGQQQQQQQQQQYGSPYPNVPHQQQQQHGAWNTGGGAPAGILGGSKPHGPYGAHDGPATVSDLMLRRRGLANSSQPVVAAAAPYALPYELVLLLRSWNETMSGGGGGHRSAAVFATAPAAVVSSLSRIRSLTKSAHLFPSSFPAPLRSPPSPLRLALMHHQQQRTYSIERKYRATMLSNIFRRIPPFLRISPTLYQMYMDNVGNWFSDQQNQDMVNAQNSYYVNLRNQAIHEGDLMSQCFQKSKNAYNAGDGAQAKNLSEQGHAHQQKRDQLNDEAANWIFNENNKVQPEGSIDLHGLYVQESIEFTERAVENARARGLPQLRVIVGKGNHSANHVAKIKPAIEDLMRRQKLSAHLDPHNSGVLVVLLQGQGGGSRGIADDLEKDPDVCVIM